jgi:hypothetical protein
MIWHIFKKDLRLLWPLTLAVAALHAITPVLVMGSDPKYFVLVRLLAFGGPLASGFLLTIAVHEDAIPGVRQDWLVRPIHRTDLILAKLLFAALAVQLPIWIGDLAAFLVNGFSLPAALLAASGHSVVQMLVINLPFLALASVTRNLLELISGAVIVSIVIAVADAAGTGAEPVIRTGLQWIETLAAYATLFIGASVVLMLQYFRRRTAIARILTGAAAVFSVMVWFIPWQPAFAVQRALSPAPGSGQQVNLIFDPAAGKFHRPPGALSLDEMLTFMKGFDTGTVSIYLPLRITGLRPDSAVRADHSEVRLITQGRTTRMDLEPWDSPHDESDSTPQTAYPPIKIPAALYSRIKDEPVRIEVESWLTLVQIASSNDIPAIGGDQRIPGFGRCRTKVNDAETGVELSCTVTEKAAPCMNMFLQHVPTAQRNPNRFACSNYASYAPFLSNPLFPVALLPATAILPFRDRNALAHYPVDGSKLPESRVVVQIYRLQDHFVRKVVIPEIRLSDWGAETEVISTTSSKTPDDRAHYER